jgi:RimJ/RimL family protein N-acetyltransferase
MSSPVVIRQHRERDVEASYSAVRESIEELGRWMPWCHPGYSLQDAKEWVSGATARFIERSAFEFVISNDGGDYLGGCGLSQLRPVDRVANLGYWVRSSQTSQGIATSAAREVAAWAFAQTNLVRLEIVVAVGNVGSQRVAEKVGARREGVLRKRLFLNGRSEDALMFALFRPE